MGLFHEGEQAVQARAGAEAESRRLGRGISPAIPEDAGPFLEVEIARRGPLGWLFLDYSPFNPR